VVHPVGLTTALWKLVKCSGGWSLNRTARMPTTLVSYSETGEPQLRQVFFFFFALLFGNLFFVFLKHKQKKFKNKNKSSTGFYSKGGFNSNNFVHVGEGEHFLTG